MIKSLKIITTALFAALLVSSCEEQELPVVEYLDVNANNISGSWELVEWNGSRLESGTYVYMDILRDERTFTLYQNVDSFNNVPHTVTGRYALDTDPELGAIIRGSYDYDSGDWSHRYIIKDLTSTEMTWVAKDDATYIQKYVRVDSIPVKE